jgi:hypothetical protein
MQMYHQHLLLSQQKNQRRRRTRTRSSLRIPPDAASFQMHPKVRHHGLFHTHLSMIKRSPPGVLLLMRTKCTIRTRSGVASFQTHPTVKQVSLMFLILWTTMTRLFKMRTFCTKRHQVQKVSAFVRRMRTVIPITYLNLSRTTVDCGGLLYV